MNKPLDLNPYLEASEIVDWYDPDVSNLAKQLAREGTNDEAIAKAAFLCATIFNTAWTFSDLKLRARPPMFYALELGIAMQRAICSPHCFAPTRFPQDFATNDWR